MNSIDFKETMEFITVALKERGYDPYAQLYGYITQNEPTYITNHNNARSIIQTLDFDTVKQYVENMKKGV